MMSQEDTGVTQQGLLQEATTKHFHMSKEVKKQETTSPLGLLW